MARSLVLSKTAALAGGALLAGVLLAGAASAQQPQRPQQPQAQAKPDPAAGRAGGGAGHGASAPPARAQAEAAQGDGAPPLPRGITPEIWTISVPPGKEPTKEKVALGEKLFNEKRLSADDTISCATCHDEKLGFADGKPQAVGIRDQRGQRNSPTVANALFLGTQFWDGRASMLEDQAKLPILNPIEMGMKTPDEVVAKVRAIPEYAQAFQKVYGREVTYDDLADAIAAFERTLVVADSPFDRFLAGDPKAISASARRGWSLFNGKGRCNTCHAFDAASPLFTDQRFHNIGIAAHKQDFVQLAREGLKIVRTGDAQQIDELALETKFSELGRFLVTKQQNDIGGFKTSPLRNVGVTAPYMHDGSLATLWDVMDHYNTGGEPNPFLDGGMQRLGLTEREIDDVVAFMFALTGSRFEEQNRRAIAAQTRRKNVRPERDTAVAMGKKGHLGDLAPPSDLADPANMGVVTIALDSPTAGGTAPVAAPKGQRQGQGTTDAKGGSR
jgi:cytochrome c peroxidase